MSAPVCTVCQMNNAVTSCGECKQLACGDCSTPCQVCAKSLCKDHVQLTSRGRKLCSQCMAERNAQRKKLKRERRRQQATEQQAASTSFEDLMSGDSGPSIGSPAPPKPTSSAPSSPTPASAGTSFEDLFEGGPLLKPQATEEEVEREAGLLPPEGMGSPEYDDLDPMEKERQAKLGRTEAEFTETGRLELPPMDENRPVLGASGYQPPSRWKKLAAFVFFGIGMMYFWTATPYLRETMMPWDSTPLDFQEEQMPSAMYDDNRIRNSSNVNQFEFFSQGPVFFIAWVIFLAYVGGTLAIVISMIRSAWWSWRAKLNLEAADDLEKDRNELLM